MRRNDEKSKATAAINTKQVVSVGRGDKSSP
jgi:hypothetical protein